MRRWLIAAVLLAALPATAQEASLGPSIQAEPDEYVVRPLLEEATAAERRGDLGTAFAKVEQALAQLRRPTPFRAWVNCMYGARLLESDKPKARAAIAECYARLPDHPAAKIVYGRLLIKDGDTAAGYRMMAAGIRGDPRWMENCDTTTTGWIRTELRVLAYDRSLDDVRAELIEALTGTACGSEDPAFYSGLMRDVIARRLARGDIEAARAGLPAVLDPDDLLMMLVDRRYQRIWPDIERLTGGDLEAQRVAFVHKVRQTYTAAPSIETAAKLAYALAGTGGLGEAIGLLATALANPTFRTGELYEEGTAAVRLADMYHRMGETREAVVTGALRKLLAGRDPWGTPSLWNVVPNLARWMIIYGKPTEALTLLDRYVPPGSHLDSPAARGYFAALRGCAQSRSGDAAGQAALVVVLRDYAGNKGAAQIAATCGTDRDALREKILALMEDEQERSALLLDLMRLKLLGANGSAVTSYEHAAFASLLAEPAFARRLDEMARDPGPRYRAALSQWRKH